MRGLEGQGSCGEPGSAPTEPCCDGHAVARAIAEKLGGLGPTRTATRGRLRKNKYHAHGAPTSAAAAAAPAAVELGNDAERDELKEATGRGSGTLGDASVSSPFDA